MQAWPAWGPRSVADSALEAPLASVQPLLLLASLPQLVRWSLLAQVPPAVHQGELT